MRKLHSSEVLFLVFLDLFSCPILLLANPEGGQIEAGNAIISAQQTGEKLNQELNIIQTSEKAIVNWDKFSIQEGEITNFVLPSSSSSTLNRVTGGSLSEIYGTLKSNGDLLLINPQGVMIGPNGLVDVGGFLASTYDLKNEEFLRNKSLNFFDDKFDEHNASEDPLNNSSIVNQGQIIARNGDIILMAKDIDNQGQLQAPKGEIYLKGGCEVTLVPNEENKVKVRLKRKGSVRNSGTIKAIKAEIEACGGSSECLAVSNEGVIEALGVGKKDGKLVLLSDEDISVSGTLIAKNEVQKETQDKQVNSSDSSTTLGGKIYLLGNTINLEKGAVINASGDLGGGEVLIGGDFQGKNPEIKNASYVYMDKEASVHADAIDNGNGGKVILWSEKGTDWRGLVTTKGGKENGDGGLIEVSSHGFLNPKGLPNATALNGQTGTFLLDPYNITVSAAVTANGAFGGGNPNTFTPSGTPCTLLNTDLQTALFGANVIVTTSGGGAEDGDITVSTAVTSATGNNLTLTADQNITLSANVSVTGNLAFNVNQGGSGGIFTLGSGISATATGTTAITGNATGTSAMTFTGPSATTVTMTGAYAGSVAGSMTVDSFSNIQAITASGHSDDTLVGPAGGQVFNILDDASGGSITNILTTFTSFPKLTGGSGDDQFIFQDSGEYNGPQKLDH